VATCGTAFGAEHIKVLRRLLMDDSTMKGNVVFTFDGDAAGQKAALRAFEEDQKFVSQTFVAVEKSGLDPCDLRLAQGDAAVRDLVEHKVPLFEFAIRSTLASYDLDSAEGRINGLRDAAPIVAKIRDSALRPEYTRRLAGWLGMDVETVAKAVATSMGGGRNAGTGSHSRSDGTTTTAQRPVPQTHRAATGSALAVEREALKGVLQLPTDAADWYATVEEVAYSHPSAIAVHRAIVAAGGPAEARSKSPLVWIDSVLEQADDDEVRRLIRELCVEPMPADEGAGAAYVTGVISRLLEMDATRRIDELKSRVQRADEREQPQLFADLMALEEYRRMLRTQAQGES
jgi:DNA primase